MRAQTSAASVNAREEEIENRGHAPRARQGKAGTDEVYEKGVLVACTGGRPPRVGGDAVVCTPGRCE